MRVGGRAGQRRRPAIVTRVQDPSNRGSFRPDVPARRQPHLRASDADRNDVIEALQEAAGQGRLTLDELDQRIEVAFNAKTVAELEPLTADIPAARAMQPAVPVRLHSTLSSLRRAGYWEVPPKLDVHLALASARIDLTQARLSSSVVEIVVSGWASSLDVIVPTGSRVDISGLVTPLGTSDVRGAQAADNGVIVRITGKLLMGSVTARRLSATEAFFRKAFGR